MMSKAKQIQVRLNKTIQDFVTKALDADMNEKENQETESWFNYAVLGDSKNEENKYFKS